ncbi:MAG: NusA N-terminal domain-containing protein, partial [Zwartia sp.]
MHLIVEDDFDWSVYSIIIITAIIDKKNGEIKLYRVRTVVETVENEVTELTEAQAKKIDKTLTLGDELKDLLPPIDFGRVAAQTAKQVVL